ncbi:S-methyl-5-thioribose-1-phosphate isomerase [Sulfoacidibacillus thermotolerans]|uniref:Methylthioribose-1-phosphate isomerase n=1 Tax=Sulfoacidibacillus thermotolerans TaxID=1765684 RepID=A0A2U3D9N4_SULT2|nr:S-methyl-5-thioribose-1-phosphate isomerase [Sulfoacidibacillus thermotolerans]PWI57997.1 S-methyl-5-thioribose-1-phosphate isomerase [Sulfoacidibacillus thermotolerans]
MGEGLRTLLFEGDRLRLIDQTKLPTELRYVMVDDEQTAFSAIRSMQVRGAPAIGMTAAYGLYLGLKKHVDLDKEAFFGELKRQAEFLKGARPTAVNLAWAIERLVRVAHEQRAQGVRAVLNALREEAKAIQHEDERACRTMGENLQAFIKDGMGILTHCNTGALAASQYGTALAGFYVAHERGLKIHVYADETRPFLQGARLTAWELQQAGIDVTLICDNMAASVMASRKIQAVMVGADRIAANGDTANKIGTYQVAILAKYFQIPFYIVAPWSTIDPKTTSGREIPIEERPAKEVTEWGGVQIAPRDVPVYNPAFDVTPHELITAIVTEKGIYLPPYHFA